MGYIICRKHPIKVLSFNLQAVRHELTAALTQSNNQTNALGKNWVKKCQTPVKGFGICT
jgi:hypothetical protein